MGVNPTVVFQTKVQKNNLVNIAGVCSNAKAEGRETKFSP